MEGMEKIKSIIKEQEQKEFISFLKDSVRHAEGARAGNTESLAWVKKLLRAGVDHHEAWDAIPRCVMMVAVEQYLDTASDSTNYLDPKNPRYAPKLAAAVRAWQAVTDPGGHHPKQALEKWVREHASEFGLLDDDGNPINQAVEDCGKVANWKPGGGAPKTPGG